MLTGMFGFWRKERRIIRILCHGSDNGINLVVWAPPFFLPNVLTLVRKLELNNYQLDMDIGEIFLNFPLHPEAWKHCGFNLTGIKGLRLSSMKSRLVWKNVWMGFRSISDNTVQHLSQAKEIAKGDHRDSNNPFY